jgi:site-specific recombinase XerD
MNHKDIGTIFGLFDPSRKSTIPTTFLHYLWSRYDRRDIHRMFINYKIKAGISKPGAVHCYNHDSNGCDIRIVQKILRHNDIKTTLPYAHASGKTQRESYEKFLTF